MAKPENDRGVQGEEPGEGNHEADRRYREATERFVKQGGVEPAADEARRAIDDDKQRKDLEEAEQAGRSRGPRRDSDVE
jgi:hypothetical protein